MGRFGLYAYHYRRLILAVAIVLAAAAGWYGVGVFDAARPFGFSDPDSESSRAYEEIEEATRLEASPGVVVVVDAGGPADLRRHTNDKVTEALRAIDGIGRVTGPGDDAPQRLTSDNGSRALVIGYLERSVEDPAEVGERAIEAFEGMPGVNVGGVAVAAAQLNDATEEDLRRIELFAAPFLLLISLLVFRGLVAALLPLLVGGLSIAFTLAGLRALTEVIEVDIFALNVITVLGLGLAIDYSLFMVSRYREEIERHGPGSKALGAMLAPVGRMILFSAIIVAASVAALAVFPQRFLYSTGIGCALVALISAAVVLLVLPAVLAILGERVNSGSPGRLQRSATRSPGWNRVGRLVLSRPLPVALLVTALMLVAGLPFLRAELTRADARVLPKEKSAFVVDTTIREEFSADPSDPLLVVVDAGRGSPGAELEPAVREVRRLSETSQVRASRLPNGDILVAVATEKGPYSDVATDLVETLREVSWGADALVTGPSAELVDQRESLRAHLPYALAIIVAVTIAALFVMTGSVVLPILAVFANTLTICMALGVLVLLFQDGRLEELLVFESVGAIDLSVPILLFAVIFGLSTDYGVFLLSRVGEARQEGVDDDEAIVIGLERTGKIITAAALLFAVAMGAFVFSRMIFIKEVAVGTALAVLIDAMLVRTLLFPSLMKLCGSWTWRGPAFARRWAGRA